MGYMSETNQPNPNEGTTTMKRIACLLAVSAIALSACAVPQLEEYTPIVDPGAPNAGRFQSDLASCRIVAKQAEANYKTQASNQAAQQAVAGAIVGALLGAALGNSSTAAAGAAYGIGAGASSVDYEQQHGGPRRIIDRCMAQRGHQPLNDIGRG